MDTKDKIENLEGEVWKDVVGYEGLYQVSNKGRVKSLFTRNIQKERILKGVLAKEGYIVVSLYKNKTKKQFRVHRILWDAFYGNLPKWNPNLPGNDRMEINHKDENPSNNNIENLELISCTQNLNYGSHNKKMVKSLSKIVYQYTLDGKLVKIWQSAQECHRHGFVNGAISRCCRNKYNRFGKEGRMHKGFLWSYHPLTKKQCIDSANYTINRHKKVAPKKVYQYTKDYVLVKVWNSVFECGKNGYTQQHVCNCCNQKEKFHKGFIWSYKPLNIK